MSIQLSIEDLLALNFEQLNNILQEMSIEELDLLNTDVGQQINQNRK